MGDFLRRALVPVLTVAFLLSGGTGCSIRQLAMNRIADAMAGSGTTYSADNDPELVRDALPFTLKLMETILAGNPNHIGLLTSLANGFTQYGYGFIEQEAERVEDDDLERARQLQERAAKLYARALGYALRGLEVRHAGFTNALARDPGAAVAMTDKADVPLLYWGAAAWAAAIAQGKDDPRLVGDLAKVEAFILRALALDEAWCMGSIHSFLIPFEMARATGEGDPVERATRHFRRALELADGKLAGPWVAYAESVCIPLEDRAEFERVLNEALAVDVNAAPEVRVENLLMQERARWLLGRIDRLFLPELPPLE